MITSLLVLECEGVVDGAGVGREITRVTVKVTRKNTVASRTVMLIDFLRS